MTRILRAALAGCAVLALSAPVAVAQSAAEWPQAHSDIRPEPAARFGILANGMHYIVLHNATPPSQTSIRMRIGSGSLEEADDQQGLAHFLEHMAFKGSTNVPEGEMVKVLQRHGLAFGPDTNAFTSFDQTIYQLDLPESDADSLKTGLMLMRETASELTIDAKAMEPERGVVLSEERLRDTPSYEAAKKQQGFLMQGQLPPTRWPIGKVAVIQHAPASLLRSFYRANYRPERATLIVVGDFDVDQMEAAIKARFGDWKGVGPAAADPVLGQVATRGKTAQVIVQPGMPLSLSVSWAGPHDPSLDTRAKEVRDSIETLGLNIINRRMERLARSDNPPFLAAAVGRSDQLRTIRTATLTVTPKGDDWKGALTAADGVRRQALQYGVQPGELSRAITVAREQLRGAVAGAATRRTPNLAQQILADVDAQEVFTTPQENLSIFEQAVKDLKPEQVDAALRQTFTGNGPLISMISPTPLPGGEAAVVASFDAAEAAPVKSAEVIETKAWPYATFGEPGKVVDTRAVPDLGVTYVHFANGTRLIFKPTKFRTDQVQVSFSLPGGLLSMRKDRPTPLWASSVVAQGGMGKMSLEEAEQVLAGKLYGFNARVGEETFVLSGQTRRIDLDLEAQVITAFMTDPGWRPSAFQRMQSLIGLQLDQLDSTPQGVLARNLESLLHNGDARWANPTHTQVDATKEADIRAVWDPVLAHDPVEVTIVGDLTLEQAISAVAKTVGSLPPRGPAVADLPDAKSIRFPAPTAQPVRMTHKGRADQAIAYIAWPSTDYFANPQEARALALAVAVFQDRMIQKVRIAEGASYSPTAALRTSEVFPGYGVVSASVETPPAKLDSFFRDVAEITASLRDHPVTADELERAVKPRVEQIEKAQETNEYWMGRLPGTERDPAKLDVIRKTIPGYKAVTVADIQAVARKYLRDDTAYRIEVVPEATAAAPAKP